MTRVQLRSEKGSVLTIQEADDALKHLRDVIELTTSTQLYSGGRYLSTGTVTHTLPTDGNVFQLRVVSGTCTLTGATVDGDTDPSLGAGLLKTYIKLSGAWTTQDNATQEYVYSTGSKFVDFTQPRMWIETPLDAVLTIPVAAAENTLLDIVRQGIGNLRVDTSGGEGIIDPSTGSPDITGMDINESGRRVLLRKTGGNWAVSV